MSNNKQLYPGDAGPPFTAATDEIAGVDFQRVKLTDGTEDSTTDIRAGHGTAANALRVELPTDGTGVIATVGAVTAISNALPAGDNNIGNVDIVSMPALPAGNNNIGDVDVASLPALPAGNNNIGDVDVVSLVPGVGATNLGKQEDAVHSSGDVGVMALAVRQDASSALAGDGDYIPLSVDSSGALRVSGGGGGTQYTEADTDATITGTAILWEDTSDTLRAVSAAKPLPVTPISLPASTNTIEVVGDVAEDAPLAGNPVRVGGRASDVRPTAMSGNGDIVSPWLALSGGQVRQQPHVAATALTFAAGLQSLTASATVGQVSGEIDLTAASPTDVAVQMTFTHSGSAPSGSQTYEVYVLSSFDGTVYDGDTSYSGAAGAYTLGAAASINLTQLGVIRAHAAAGVYSHTWSLKNALGFTPRFFAIVVINNAGTALASSGNSGAYTLIY